MFTFLKEYTATMKSASHVQSSKVFLLPIVTRIVMNQKLCINNCGFYGSPLTSNLCSMCFRSRVSSGDTTNNPASGGTEQSTEVENDKFAVQFNTSRCWKCNKKIGLIGIKCRCGYTFCNSHRHADSHTCTFDYKTHATKLISKDNPVIKAEKIDKI